MYRVCGGGGRESIERGQHEADVSFPPPFQGVVIWDEHEAMLCNSFVGGARPYAYASSVGAVKREAIKRVCVCVGGTHRECIDGTLLLVR